MNNIIVISGFSGSGKTTIRDILIKRFPELYEKCITMTTRKRRHGEVANEDYIFTTKDCFKKLCDEGGILEWTEYAGNYYGTPLKEVNKILAEKKDVLLILDMQGAKSIKEKYPNAYTIFISPPSMMDLKERIISRGTEDEESLKKRFDMVDIELNNMSKYDDIFVNVDAELTAYVIHKRIETHDEKTESREKHIHALKKEWEQISKNSET